MGIRSGSKNEGGAFGGRGGKQNRALITPPQKPIFKPIENPFPEKEEFRLGVFRVVEEKDDYLICRGFDPNAKDPFAGITPAALRTVKVMKPPLLQKSPWNGQTRDVGGVEYSYEYSDDEIGVRTRTWTDDDGDHEEEQRIEEPYFVGDIIEAVEVRRNSFLDGMKVNDTRVNSEGGAVLTWVDQNVSGRHWHSPSPFDCKLPIGDRFWAPAGLESQDIEDHVMTRGCGWEYRLGTTGNFIIQSGGCIATTGNNLQVVTFPDTHVITAGQSSSEVTTGLSVAITFSLGTAINVPDPFISVYILFFYQNSNNFWFVQFYGYGAGTQKTRLSLFRVSGGVTSQIQTTRTNWTTAWGARHTMWLTWNAQQALDYGINIHGGEQFEDPPAGDPDDPDDQQAIINWWNDETNWPKDYIVDRYALTLPSLIEPEHGVGFGCRVESGEQFVGTAFHCFTAGFGSQGPV